MYRLQLGMTITLSMGDGEI